MPGRRRTQKAVIVRIAESHLQGVVVDIADREFGAHAGQPEGLELQPCHSARGVLSESLVHPQTDFPAGDHVPFHQVGPQNLVGHIHGLVPCLSKNSAGTHSPPAGDSG